MHENLRYEHGKPHTGYTSVTCNKEYAVNTENQNTWCNMATSEERLRNRRERDRLRRQMETTEEREATVTCTKHER